MLKGWPQANVAREDSTVKNGNKAQLRCASAKG